MSCKLLEKHKEAEREISDEIKGNKSELEYYILISETDDLDNDTIQQTYGVEIVKNVEGLLSESKAFENVFTDMERIKGLIKVLADNTVTPVSLPYILDDLLGA